MKHKKALIVTAKLLLAGAALFYVFRKVDTTLLWHYITTTSPLSLIAVFVILNITQLVSAFRMRYYLNSVQCHIKPYYTVALYYVGMFFNTILPGGIGGDGYKVYKLGKLGKCRHLTSARVLLCERANGLLWLCIAALTMTCFSRLPTLLPYGMAAIPVLFIILIVGYVISTPLILREKLPVALGASPYSFALQILAIPMIILLFHGMGVPLQPFNVMADYVVLFFIATIASVIPISIGGAGLREVVFLYGTQYLHLDTALGVAVALLFFTISLAASLLGLPFYMKLEHIPHS